MTDAIRRRGPGAVAVVVVPLALATIISLRRQWTPIGDLALVELELRGFWSHPPLLGPYSRFGWSHPGPFMYWALWIPWKVLGGGARGLLFATLLWHTASAGVSMWFAGRCGGRGAQLVTALALAGTAVVIAPDALIQPWNPYLNLMLVPAMVWAWSSAMTGDRTGMVGFVVVASIMSQNHLGLLPPMLLLGGLLVGWTVIGVVRAHRTADRSTGSPVGVLRTLALAAGAGLAVWALPIFEQFRHSPGNFGLLFSFARSDADRVGTAGAIRVFGRMLGPTPPWLGIRPPLDDLVGGMDVTIGGWRTWPVLALVPMVAWIIARRRGDTSGARILVHLGVVLACGLPSIASISGLPHEYLIAWMSTVSGMWVVSGLWVATRALVNADDERKPLVTLTPANRKRVWMGGVAVCATALAVSIVVAPNPYQHIERAASTVGDQLIDSLGPSDDDSAASAVEFADVTDLDAGELITALVARTTAAGWRTFVPPRYSKLGYRGDYVSTDRPSDRITLVLASGLNARDLRHDGGWEEIARYQPFPPTVLARIEELMEKDQEMSQIPNQTPEEHQEQFYVRIELSKLKGDTADVAVFRQLGSP